LSGPPITAPISAPSPTDTLAYGAYLAGPLGHCLECHTPWVQGRPDMSRMGAGGNPFKGPWGVAVSANLTPHASGLKDWKDAEIARAIREGVRRDGSPLRPPMAYGWYKNISAPDMAALIAYLRSLPAQPLAVSMAPAPAAKN
jgi:mono/diheme cytochrome c family protein